MAGANRFDHKREKVGTRKRYEGAMCAHLQGYFNVLCEANQVLGGDVIWGLAMLNQPMLCDIFDDKPGEKVEICL